METAAELQAIGSAFADMKHEALSHVGGATLAVDRRKSSTGQRAMTSCKRFFHCLKKLCRRDALKMPKRLSWQSSGRIENGRSRFSV